MKTLPTKTKANGQSGFTLLELLLVIGVAALLLIGGIATYRLVSDGNRATESTRLLLTIRQESQVMAQQQGGNYTGLGFDSATSSTTAPLVTSGVLRNNQRNSFNGPIVLTPVNDAAGTINANLQVSFGNVSQASCIKMAQSINNANEVVSISVNGTVVAASTVPAGGAGGFPVTAAAASAGCSAATNTILWQFP